jgi:hypothetical protein
MEMVIRHWNQGLEEEYFPSFALESYDQQKLHYDI